MHLPITLTLPAHSSRANTLHFRRIHPDFTCFSAGSTLTLHFCQIYVNSTLPFYRIDPDSTFSLDLPRLRFAFLSDQPQPCIFVRSTPIPLYLYVGSTPTLHFRRIYTNFALLLCRIDPNSALPSDRPGLCTPFGSTPTLLYFSVGSAPTPKYPFRRIEPDFAFPSNLPRLSFTFCRIDPFLHCRRIYPDFALLFYWMDLDSALPSDPPQLRFAFLWDRPRLCTPVRSTLTSLCFSMGSTSTMHSRWIYSDFALLFYRIDPDSTLPLDAPRLRFAFLSDRPRLYYPVTDHTPILLSHLTLPIRFTTFGSRHPFTPFGFRHLFTAFWFRYPFTAFGLKCTFTAFRASAPHSPLLSLCISTTFSHTSKLREQAATREVPRLSPGPSGVLLMVFGCILYPSTQPKRSKLSAPNFGPLAPTEGSNGHLNYNPTSATEQGTEEPRLPFTNGPAQANTQSWDRDYRKEATAARGLRQATRRSRASSKPRDNRSQHDITFHRRIAGVSESIQYGTLKIPLGAKITHVISERISEIICLSRGTPERSQAPF
ncbi:hypothetical protein CRG98_018300 [Punica granatum]|uniref:Uncharacterized protein n=1 Tax=Punica granatum TaxID=22663 RepID=A0A2I0JYA2_PUNGR|nr:hypothetical protein CRG98_018300 [Punica granatum]